MGGVVQVEGGAVQVGGGGGLGGRVLFLYFFGISIFGDEPLNFCKGAFGAKYILILRGDRAPKKTQFFGQNFPKSV